MAQLQHLIERVGARSERVGVTINHWHVLMLLGAISYAAVSCLFAVLGQPNADEGWYLYASKLVYGGVLPYQDFAYTQMPLLPYVYGIPQRLFGPSLLVGRLTSVVLSLGTFGMCCSIARRYGDERAAAITALLLLSWTYGVYYQTIVKTYALVSFFVVATFWLLSSKLNDDVRLPLAVICALAAAMTRLSALVFAIPIVAYSFTLKPKTMLNGAAHLLHLSLLILLVFVLPNRKAITWNLLTHHVGQWGDTSVLHKLAQIVGWRLPSLVLFWGPYIALAVYALCHTHRRTSLRTCLRCHAPLAVFVGGITLFVASHLLTGGWHLDYFVPAATALLPLVAVLLSNVYTHLQRQVLARRRLTRAFGATLMYGALTGVYFVDVGGMQTPLEEITEVAAVVADHAQPSDKVLALEALWVAVEADRATLPGMSMAQFSYQPMERQTAQALDLVNGDIVVEQIERNAAAVIVLTALDWQLFEQSGYAAAVREGLAQHYRLAFTKDHFGQHAQRVEVWVLNQQTAPHNEQGHAKPCPYMLS
jgi:hypothetical protein